MDNHISILVSAGFGFDTAVDLIKYLINRGFSVEATQEGRAWTIRADKEKK